jgi:hypothetical protein
MIEPLKEIPAPPPELPPCDIRYVTIGAWKHRSIKGEVFWSSYHHKTIESANADAEWYVPGTMRIFEIPERKP